MLASVCIVELGMNESLVSHPRMRVSVYPRRMAHENQWCSLSCRSSKKTYPLIECTSQTGFGNDVIAIFSLTCLWTFCISGEALHGGRAYRTTRCNCNSDSQLDVAFAHSKSFDAGIL